MNARLLPAAFLLLGSAPLWAAGEGAKTPKHLDVLELFLAGGFSMYPLVILSVITIALALYCMTIRRNSIVSDRFMDTTEAMIRARDFHGLAAYSRRSSEMMARIVQRIIDFILRNPTVTLDEIRELAQSEGSRQIGRLGSRVAYLADIGSVAPLMGLLGTVIGMIKTFIDLSGGKEGVKQLELTSGISTALVCTAAGLIVAVPAMLLYSFFRTRVHRFASELESASSHFVALLQQAATSPSSRPAPPPAHHIPPQESPMPVPAFALEPRNDLQGI
jgi:biopolymer transport protein ExbB